MSAPAGAVISRTSDVRLLSRDLLESLRNPEFWALSSWLDIVVRYRQSRLGMVWMIVPAIMYIWCVGAYMAPTTPGVRAFVAHVGLGFVVFRLINSVMIESTSAFNSAQAFIYDGNMRLTDYVLRVIAKALFYFIASLPVVLSALIAFPDTHWAALPLVLCALPLIVLNLVWVAVVFALGGARYRDLGQFVSNIFLFGFLLTPIVWYPESMPEGSLRAWLMRANPIYHMVEIVRAPLMGTPMHASTFYYLAVMTLGGWLLAIMLYRRYARFIPIWI